MTEEARRRALVLFFAVVALAALAAGMAEPVMASYYKEAYHVTAVQRGFIEFPRETPGMLCAVLIAALSTLGDIRIALISHILTAIGLGVLGLFTPAYGVMLTFLFVYSMGTHLFMPVQDAIGMSLAEPGYVGRRMGQYASVKAGLSFFAAGVVFVGFRAGFFDFTRTTKLNFVIGGAASVLAALFTALLVHTVGPQTAASKKFKLTYRRQYKYYYLLTVLGGVQKQIALVYGSWVVIELLGKGADTLAMLYIVANFLCIFFMRALGGWIDRFGIKKMMFLDAFTFIGVYVVYGLAVWSIEDAAISRALAAGAIYVLFVADRLSMQVGMVKSVYLRSIAWDPKEVSAVLSTGTSFDHIVTIFAGAAGGLIWEHWGSHWVFFVAAAFSVGNVLIAAIVKPEEEQAFAANMREQLAAKENT
ncbi:MAG TPA: MFS transporter [Candidatus Acidoferrum sp.]|nr:MFS transporter [Candidatus Acidoferrum sp.]